MKYNYIKLCIAAMATIVVMMLTGCKNTYKDQTDKINIVCTTFAQYDWVREIAGDNMSGINLVLLGNGADMHSYQPTTGDILTISDADMFIYVGGISEEWVKNVQKQSENPNMIVINMMDVLGNQLYEEEHIEGMEEEHEHDHSQVIEYDEHVWLSLRNAIKICESIKDGLVTLDNANEEEYNTNYNNYVKKLEEVDKEYEMAVDNASCKTLLFGDRFPFIYMIKDYGLKYYAAFVGCSAETEASFETVTFLANKLDELNLPAILIVEGSKVNLAKTINESTKNGNYPIYTLDSMQNVTIDNIENGKTYIDTMKSNLEILKKALGYVES